MFVASELKVIAEVLLEISHDLLSVSGDLSDIRKVVSHPQALGQCRAWLEENLPDATLVDVGSTALAAQMVADDPSAAAIASETAASLYGLKAVKKKIGMQKTVFDTIVESGDMIEWSVEACLHAS